MPMPSVYSTQARVFFDRYEALEASEIKALLERWVSRGQRVLELGCGSGRDARLMASLGARVTAVDGSAEMLELAREKARQQTAEIDWRAAQVPVAPEAEAAIISEPYDVLYSCGLLQHLCDHELYDTAAFVDRAVSEAGTVIVLVPLDHRGEDGRQVFAREALEYEALFERMGFRRVFRRVSTTGPERSACRWAQWVFLRADGSDRATRRLRTIVERDKKTSTYKLAVLRALCEINRTSPRLVRFEGDRAVLPVGLLAEKIIGYYLQLSIPGRMPKQIGGSRVLGFERELEAVRNLVLAGSSLRRLTETEATAPAVWELFRAVVTVLDKGPFVYTTDEQGVRVFSRLRCRVQRSTALLTRFGEVAFPAEIWLELNRVAPWLEDSVVLEWARLSERFERLAEPEDGSLGAGDVAARLLERSEVRNTQLARKIYSNLAGEGRMCCVWSGKLLSPRTMVVDHMMPWARFHRNAARKHLTSVR